MQPMIAGRKARARSACTFVAGVLALILGSFLLAPAAPAQVINGTTVRVDNLISFEGDPEELTDQQNAVVTTGTEFVGFAGFDIDVSADRMVLSWSDEARFDSFEATLDGTFSETFRITLADGEFTAATVGAGTLSPRVVISGNTLRVTFAVGDTYGDGQEAVVDFTFVPDGATPTPTPATTGTSSTGQTASSPPATPTVSPVPNDFSGLRGMVEAAPSGTAKYFVVPNPVAAPTVEPSQATTSASTPGLAVSGRTSLPLTTAAIGLAAVGAALLIGSRRSYEE